MGHVEHSQVAKNWRIKILQLTIFMSQKHHHRKLDQHTNHVEKSGGDAHATNIRCLKHVGFAVDSHLLAPLPYVGGGFGVDLHAQIVWRIPCNAYTIC